VRYTDIESLRKYPNIIEVGEEVWVSEKIHGCLLSDTKISMSDGSRKPIRNICVEDMVVGMDLDGSIVESKVLNIFNNGKSSDWLVIKTTNKGSNKGNHFRKVVCTPNHRFWNGQDYVEASSLQIGDIVYSIRNDLEISYIQEQVILGKLLGDGCLIFNNTSAHISFGHKTEHLEYLQWTNRGLGDLSSGYYDEYVSGYGSEMTRSRSKNNFFIRQKFISFIDNQKKVVPEWVANEIGPIAIAFWYMDDGSLSTHEDQEDRANFAVCGFTERDCEILQEGLRIFDINSVLYQAGGYNRLRLNSDDAEKLFLLIAPYIPSSMQYKLPVRYRGHSGWLPDGSSGVYKQSITKQKIISIDRIQKSHTKYDIETSTHNFFANNILVHNSNSRFVWQDGELHAGTHNNWLKHPDDCPYVPSVNCWWNVVKKYNLQEKLQQYPNIEFFGEVYGYVQFLKYDHKPGEYSLRIFDAFDISAGKYIDKATLVPMLKNMDMLGPPIMYLGPWPGYEAAKPWANGKSLIAENIREGFVVRPLKERYHDKVGRVILKLVGEDFLVSSGKQK
jgi:hypothetical protein